MKSKAPALRKFRYWLGDLICLDRFFNEDASLEIDRLTLENETLKERIQELEGWND